jgi:NAD(P)-dependent dehydrogenase (short-subunit alcohol dehydrogenase family)
MTIKLRPLRDQAIVITGASSGIGLVTAKKAARHGAAVVLAARNERDLREAVTWYRARDPDLANRFLDEVYRTLALLERFPHIGGPVYGVAEPNIRQLPVNNFPYQVVFKRREYRTSVLAIAHDRKKPGYWNE